jgi:hypothetical protein
MSCYLFQNKNVYVITGGRVECMPWDDFIASSMVEDKNAHILIAEADGPLLMEHVRQIRQAFPRRGIKTCVPYAAALRMFLQKRGLISTGESFLVADDLGDKFLLTASNRLQMAVTRAILSQEPAKIVDEIRRTQKNEPILRILSNSSQVIEALDPERKKEARFFEASFPAFEVLGKVKFPAQLMPPEELLMQKQSDLRRGFIAAWVMAVFMAGAGVMCFSYAQAKENGADQRIVRLMRDKTELRREERELAGRTYQDRLKAMPQASFFEVFGRFFNCLPPDSRIENILLQRADDMRWRFTGLVSFPRQEITPFVCDEAFKGAKIDTVFVQARPGLRIEYILPEQPKGVALP